MSTVKEIQEGLQAYFYADEVEWKVQATSRDKTRALMVAYIQSRAIMNRLDAVLGIDNWRDEYAPGPNGGVICGLSLRIPPRGGKDHAGAGEWVTKWDGSDNTDIEAVKGGLSGAFKRAASKWGIGRYLYNLPKYWVDLDERGRPTEEPNLPPMFLPADADRHGNRPAEQKEDQRAAAAAAPQESAKPAAGAGPEKRPAASRQKAASPATAPAEKTGAQKAGAAKKEQLELPAVAAEDSDPEGLFYARQLSIPEGIGVPMAGRSLEEAMHDEQLGHSIIAFLSGNRPNKSGKYFDPGQDEELKELQAGAQALYQAEFAYAS